MSELDPLDVAIGAEIRSRRKAAGLSLEKLGETIGVSYQQVQKYETGANRVSAAALVRLGEVLPGGHIAIMAAVTGADVNGVAFAQVRDQAALDHLVGSLKAVSPERRIQLLDGFCMIASAAPDGVEAVVATIIDRRAA